MRMLLKHDYSLGVKSEPAVCAIATSDQIYVVLGNYDAGEKLYQNILKTIWLHIKLTTTTCT